MQLTCLVAHPDDCLIFARPFMDRYADHAWTIVYLTYSQVDPRGQEITSYWNKRNIKTILLGFEDNWEDINNKTLSFDVEHADAAIKQAVFDCDLLLTHGSDGEYGHPHHIFVNSVAKTIDIPKVYFANYEFDIECTAVSTICLDELPLHREVIEQFEFKDVGRYKLSTEARNVLK